MGQIKKRRHFIILIKKRPLFFNLTHLRAEIKKIISLVFWFKWEQQNVFLKFTDLYLKEKNWWIRKTWMWTTQITNFGNAYPNPLNHQFRSGFHPCSNHHMAEIWHIYVHQFALQRRILWIRQCLTFSFVSYTKSELNAKYILGQ